MSMEVDLSTPLTKKERAYLHERGRLADLERAEAMHGPGSPEEEQLVYGDGTGPETVPVTTAEQAAQRRERLLRELAQLEEAYGSPDEDEDLDEEELVSYDELTVAELDDELKRRGLSTSGKQADKVKRLEENDAQQ